jgi:hypothetical protein
MEVPNVPEPNQQSPGSLDPQSAVGLWRDGHALVVSRRENRFPARCIKTGAWDDVRWHVVNAGLVPDSRLVKGFTITMSMLGGPGRAGAALDTIDAIERSRVPVEFGLSEKWYAKWKRISRIGWILILGGIFLFVGAVVGYVVCMVGGVPESVAGLLLIPIAIGPAASITGLVYLSISHRPLVTVKRVSDEFLWVGRVHPDFLATLPEWSGEA